MLRFFRLRYFLLRFFRSLVVQFPRIEKQKQGFIESFLFQTTPFGGQNLVLERK